VPTGLTLSGGSSAQTIPVAAPVAAAIASAPIAERLPDRHSHSMPNMTDAFFPDNILGNDPFSPLDLWSYIYRDENQASRHGSAPGSSQAPASSSAPLPMSKQGMPHLGNPISLDGQPGHILAPPERPIGEPQAPKLDNPPPWLWSDPFTSMNTKFDDDLSRDNDVNMTVEENFNWQNWQASLRDLR